MPVRIYDISKKLGIESSIVLSKAKELGIAAAKGPSSSLDRFTANYLEEILRVDLVDAMPRGFHSLALGNFKAFAEVQSLPIRPLTLIFGANSSGKSSLIHGLLLARHLVDTGELDTSRTEIGGDAVDLGGFRQFVHRRDPSRRVEVSLGLDPVLLRGQAFTSKCAEGSGNPRLTLSLGIPLDDTGNPASGSVPQLMTYRLEVEGETVLGLSGRPDGTLQLDRLSEATLEPIISAMLSSFTTAASIDSSADTPVIKKAIQEVISTLRFGLRKGLPDELVGGEPASISGAQLIPVSKASRTEELAGATKLFVPRAVGDLVQSLNATLRAQLGRVQYLGPLRSFPPRHLAYGEERGRNWFAGGGYAWDIITRNREVRERVNAWLEKPDRLQTPYRLDVRRYIAPREAEELILDYLMNLSVAEDEDWSKKEKVTMVTVPAKEGDTGALVTDEATGKIIGSLRFPNFDFEKEAGTLLTRLVADPSGSGFDDLILKDLRTDTVVTHRDVGIGVSQVLPVLVHAYADKGRIVAIEQPEIHLHPALQAELGDLFITSALGENRNTFLLETHSEHLILRILRRIRETTEHKLPEGALPVRPEDISVIFVEPTPKGSIVKHLPVTPDGDFGAPWPGGFFAERLADLP